MKTDFLQRIVLTDEEVELLYKMIKEFEEDYGVITIPAWSEYQVTSRRNYFIQGIEGGHRFNLTLQRKGAQESDRNFTICFLDAETNTMLGRLDLGKNPKPQQ